MQCRWRSKIDINELLIVSFLGVRIPIGVRNFSLSKTSRPALGPTQPSIQGVPGFFSGVKWTGLEVSHSSPSIVEVKIEWSYTSSPPICVRGVDMTDFSFRHVLAMKVANTLIFRHVCPSAWRNARTTTSLSWNKILGNFTKIWLCHFWLKLKNAKEHFTRRPWCGLFRYYLSKFLSERKNVSNKRSRYKWDTFFFLLWPMYLDIRKSCDFQDEYKWAKGQCQS